MNLSPSNLLAGSPSLVSSTDVRSAGSDGEDATSAFDSDQNNAGTFEDHLAGQVTKTSSLTTSTGFNQATLTAVKSSPSENAEAVGLAGNQSVLQPGVLGIIETFLKNNAAGNSETAGVTQSPAASAGKTALSDSNFIAVLSKNSISVLSKSKAGTGGKSDDETTGVMANSTFALSKSKTGAGGKTDDETTGVTANSTSTLSQNKTGTGEKTEDETTGVVMANATLEELAATFSSVKGNGTSSFVGQSGTAGSKLKEKKSTTQNEEGSFIQTASTETSSTVTPSRTSPADLSSQPKPTLNQQLSVIASPQSNGGNASINEAAPAISTTGIKNADGNIVMNQAAILSAPTASTTNWSTPLSSLQDVNTGSAKTLLLNSNSEFESALRQVVLSAQSYGVDEASMPRRMAIELQTPPGAIVNVYVSQQNGQWRAQLSTDDPQALNWLQNSINSLRQATPETGLDLRWSPPQTEGGSSNDAGEWSGGGQQQPQEQSERRTPGYSQKNNDSSQNWSSDFMNAIEAFGSAA